MTSRYRVVFEVDAFPELWLGAQEIGQWLKSLEDCDDFGNVKVIKIERKRERKIAHRVKKLENEMNQVQEWKSTPIQKFFDKLEASLDSKFKDLQKQIDDIETRLKE